MDTFTIDIKPKATIEACGRLFKVNGAKSAGGLYFLCEFWKAFGLVVFIREFIREGRSRIRSSTIRTTLSKLDLIFFLPEVSRLGLKEIFFV